MTWRSSSITRYEITTIKICFRYTCEFNITQYGEDSMTDLTQYSEKVRKRYDMKNNPINVKDNLPFPKDSCYSGEKGVSEGHSQSWLHCSFGEQGRIISYFALVWLVCVIRSSSQSNLNKKVLMVMRTKIMATRCRRSFQ